MAEKGNNKEQEVATIFTGKNEVTNEEKKRKWEENLERTKQRKEKEVKKMIEEVKEEEERQISKLRESLEKEELKL